MTDVIPTPRSTMLGDTAGVFLPFGDADENSTNSDLVKVTKALVRSNPDRFIEVVRDRQRNERAVLLRQGRRRNEKSSRQRNVRTAGLLIEAQRATKRAREGVEGNKPWKVYSGNMLRRVTSDELRRETLLDNRRKERQR